MVKGKKVLQKIYLAVILIMLYLPIGVLIVSSVNASEKIRQYGEDFHLRHILSFFTMKQ